MRIAYLECFSGISGDMFLGALVDAGVSKELLEETVSALDIGARLEISRVMRCGISATKVDVWVDGKKNSPREEYREGVEKKHGHSQAHNHDHSSHEHDGHSHSHAGESSRAGAPAPQEIIFSRGTVLSSCGLLLRWLSLATFPAIPSRSLDLLGCDSG